MPTAKFRASSSPDAMKPEEGNDSLDTFIRQAIGKEPYLSFSRTNDSPVQWIQLLHALDQKDIPGWPLPTPLTVQMQKCDKCSREFCSLINYRRHIRVHRRSLNFDKESHKNRDLLGVFWDKISMDEAKEIVSFNDVILEEVPGSSIIKALTSFICKPGFCALPQVYVKAGSVLLDVIQARLSRLPISSQELFSILDDASEKTFLCAGTAESMQKYVFDGEAGKIGLEMKNLVACTSFLIEQKLVKAWLADKDAEALRCQKLLVEEEEASQRRQAELLERKRQKKLRQKEQKTKEQSYEEKPDSNCTADILESPPSAEPFSSLCEGDSHALEAPADNVLSLRKPVHLLNNAEAADIETQGGYSSEHLDSGSAQNAESRKSRGKGHQHLVIARWQVPKTQKRGRNGFHPNQNLHIVKPEPLQKRTPHRDTRAASVIGSKVWTRKDKVENGGECVVTRVREEEINQTEQSSREVMIGSISVTVRNCDAQRQVNSKSESQNSCSSEHIMPRKISGQDELMKPESVQSGTNRSTVKCWRPVSTHETRGQFAVQSGNQESEDDTIPGVGGDRTVSGESCLGSCEMDGKDNESKEIMQIKGLPFSSHSARAFLAQRWKEAISGDHVTLLLSPEPECHGYHDSLNDRPVGASTTKESDIEERSILGNAENRLGNMGALESSTNRHAKAKFRAKPEKGVKIKYIPKQTVT